MDTIGAWWMWIAFFGFVSVMLWVDMFFLDGKKTHRVSTKEALGWSITWIALSFGFNFLLWFYLSHTQTIAIANEKSLEFFTGYLIEKSLSVDNIFVFLMIFQYFQVPAEFQRRVLLYGVLGAVVLRFIMILFGVMLVSEFHWILYVFGLFLLITGIKMLIFAGKKTDLGDNPLLKWMNRHLRITSRFHEEKFMVRKDKLLYVTPLFVVLMLIEISDIVFAVDSIPAIFAVTQDPFIVFTSNIFAILGLRALYFLLQHMIERFHLLKYGLAIILSFIGIKMLIEPWFKMPVLLALAVVGVILLVSILLSWNTSKKQ